MMTSLFFRLLVLIVADRLAEKAGLDPSRLTICASHTHAGPEVGNLLNLTLFYSDSPVTGEELVQIARYQEQLIDKLEQVALILTGWCGEKPSLPAFLILYKHGLLAMKWRWSFWAEKWW